MKNYKFQNDNMCNNATKVGLFLLLSFYSCAFFNAQAQKVMTVCKGNTVELVPLNPDRTVVEWKDQKGNILTRLDEKGVRITDLSPKVTPHAKTTYTVRQVDALNLISFGNFDPPPTNPSILSEYDYIQMPRNFIQNISIGFFSILDNPQELWDSTKYNPNNSAWSTNWYRSIGDHTTGDGNMFVANGAGGTVVFTSTIQVNAGETYYVGAWFANINADFINPYNMDIYVKNEKIGSLTGSNNDNWYQKYAFWTATATESVLLEFRNAQHASAGNDFAIDDIVFSPVVESTVDIIVNNPSDSTITVSLCSGEDYLFNGKVYNVAGTYSDTLVNAVGCDSIVTLILNIVSSTTASVEYQTICYGDSVLFYGNTYKTAGTYYVHLTNSMGCDSLASLVLNVNPVLTGEISGESFVCKDSVAQNIIFKGGGGMAPYTFTYRINEGSNKIITTTSGDTVSITVPTEKIGIFTYTLVSVVDANDCEYMQNISFIYSVVACQTDIKIPNTITPNNDGKNDVFMPGWKVKIYNRNGILLFNGDNGWDGTRNGAPVAQDTYFFVLYLKKEPKTKEGYITVVR